MYVCMKIDLKRQIETYKARRATFELVTVAPAQFLMIDGAGDPNAAGEYADALATLYPVAYKLKFLSKQDHDRDYVVMPLEALWWADDMESFTSTRDKSRWRWTVMNMVPDWIAGEQFESVVEQLASAGKVPLPDRIRLESFEEGLAVQTLHVGSYDDEAPAIAAMHDFAEAQGFALAGHHHEIYLNDPRRVAPEKLRTILRQPVRPSAD